MSDLARAASSQDRRSGKARGGPRWSRREILAQGAVGLLAAGFVAACGRAEAPTSVPAATAAPTETQLPTPAPAATLAAAATPPPEPSPQPSPQPTLEQMLAQMIMVGFRGTTLAPGAPIVADVATRGVGSVVLFSYDVALASPQRNVESPAQVAKLTAGLQALAREAANAPLLIAADQEGGLVARLDEAHGFPRTLAAQDLGARNDPAFTYAQAEALARTLAAAGINHNLAPVVDINSNPANPVIGALGRSFSADPAAVTEQARAFIEAHQAQGVTTTLKHFPGHGSSLADSHLGLVDVSATWQRTELEPYRTLIAEGRADAVMTAHVFNTQLDLTYPATLSAPTISGLLREELGFDGVVITDDMNMQAITGRYGFEQAAVLAVQAGADILAYGNNLVYDPAVAQRALAALAAAVGRGEISTARIEESYRRIAALKQRQTGLRLKTAAAANARRA